MKSTEIPSGQTSTNSSKWLLKGLYVAVLLVGAYYVLTRAFPMLLPSEETYGTYFWPRAPWLFPHAILGIVAITIGPFQFISAIRNKYLNVHRMMGRVYVIAVVLGGISGMYLAITTGINFPYMIGLITMSFFWTASAVMAYLAIRNKKIELHKEWMIRSYVITFTAFVFTRLIIDVLNRTDLATNTEVLAFSVWSSWVIPLLLTEIVLQWRKILQ